MIKLYVEDEQREIIINDLVDYFIDGNMLVFSKRSVELYNKYDEFTADELMLEVKYRIFEKGAKILTGSTKKEDVS